MGCCNDYAPPTEHDGRYYHGKLYDRDDKQHILGHML